MHKLDGAGASPGFAEGPAFLVDAEVPAIPDVQDPIAAYNAASAKATADLASASDAAGERGLEEAAEILRAQSMMAEDPMLAGQVADGLSVGLDLSKAIDEAAAVVTTALENSGSEYLAARAADVGEVVRRIRFALAGEEPRSVADTPPGSVIIAANLTAADTSALDADAVAGFVTEGGGPTGHVAVIARALGIPAVVGAAGACDIADGTPVLLDGGAGIVHVDADAETSAAFAAAAAAYAAAQADSARYHGAAVSVGDHPMRIAANVGSVDDVAAGVAAAADGVGLFRTEFLFLDRPVPPTEDEQAAIYTTAASSFDDPVVVRMFDIGGDKPAPYLDIPEEENPFLGVRGVRIYGEYRDIALAQAKALRRAATSGDLWVMIPMIATADDMAEVRELFEAAAAELDAEGVDHATPPIGIMVETPAAAVTAASLATKVDFFSIGTNDLTQYTMAADRTSGALARYSDAAEPAVLNLCRMTASAAVAAGISVAVCGEAGADPALAVLFAGMGIDKLSVASTAVDSIRRVLLTVDPDVVGDLVERACAASSAAEVRAMVAEAVG